MPRGTIHQAEALEGEASLHVTVSVNQMRTWADFMESALPAALSLAVDETVALRRATPPDFTECVLFPVVVQSHQSGHNNSNIHLNRIGSKNTTLCPACPGTPMQCSSAV